MIVTGKLIVASLDHSYIVWSVYVRTYIHTTYSIPNARNDSWPLVIFRPISTF